MQYALTILTYLFDMFILTTFLMNTLHHFKKRYAPLYLCVLVGCECCLYSNGFSLVRKVFDMTN